MKNPEVESHGTVPLNVRFSVSYILSKIRKGIPNHPLPMSMFTLFPENYICLNFTQCRKETRHIQGLIILYLMINVHAKNDVKER